MTLRVAPLEAPPFTTSYTNKIRQRTLRNMISSTATMCLATTTSRHSPNSFAQVMIMTTKKTPARFCCHPQFDDRWNYATEAETDPPTHPTRNGAAFSRWTDTYITACRDSPPVSPSRARHLLIADQDQSDQSTLSSVGMNTPSRSEIHPDGGKKHAPPREIFVPSFLTL